MPTDVQATQSGQTQTIDPAMALVLQTIKSLESGDYNEHHRPSPGASGAYQIIDPTWNKYGGYSRAWLAPPAVQDQFVVSHVTGIIAKYGVEGIPLYWYTGNPAHGPYWDCNNGRGSECAQYNANNGLQPGTYQSRWMNTYLKLGGNWKGGTFPDNPTGQGTDPQATPQPGSDGCLIKIPSVDLKLFSLGGWCIGGNLIRPVVGSLAVLGGSLVMLKGVTMLSKGLTDNAAVNTIKSSIEKGNAEKERVARLDAADARVAQQRQEKLAYNEQLNTQRLAHKSDVEEMRTQQGIQRRQLFTQQKVMQTSAQEQARVQAYERQREQFTKQKTGERIDARIVRKQRYDVPAYGGKKTLKKGQEGKELVAGKQ